MSLSLHELRLTLAAFLLRFFGWRVHDFVKTVHFCGLGGFVRGVRRVRRFAREKTAARPLRLAACAIMKNEGPYLREWIEFHRLVGVEKFYLYDNGCTDDTDAVLEPYVKNGVVELVRFHGEGVQRQAYEDCIERFHAHAEWIAFIDLDEFIVPCRGESVLPVLDGLPPECDQVVLDWLIFGSSGHEQASSEPVIGRFTRRGAKHWLEKSIVRPCRVYRMDVHQHFVAGRSIGVPNDVLRVNHYHCKSWEEYARKSAKGDVMHGQAGGDKYCRQCFDRHDLNDVEDLSAVRFLPALKSRLGST